VQPKTMAQWIVEKNTTFDIVAKAGIGTAIVGTLVKDGLSGLRPSLEMNTVVSLLVATLLALPILVLQRQIEIDRTIRRVGGILAIAYGFTGLLYFLKLLASFPPTGYDAVTDLVGTLFYVAAWYTLSSHRADPRGHTVERAALLVTVVIASLFAALKLVFDLGLAKNGLDPTAQSQAARLVLNACNGVVLLSLYALMRRLLQQPDAVSQVVILFYGVAQVAAHGRDCLTASPPCPPGSVECVAALGIAWTLFLGKVAFGLYVLYLYSHGRFNPAADTAAVGGTRLPPEGQVDAAGGGL
jgi:hypothetical protein